MVTINQVKSQPHSENYWMNVLLYFAAFLVGLGLIAEVAANWQDIPNSVKLGGALVLMALNSGLIWWCLQKEFNILKQVLCCIYAFLIMAVIGLIGQVFQLRANVAGGCLLWCLISWPLFILTPRLLWLWLPLFLVGVHYDPALLDGSSGFISDVVFGGNPLLDARQITWVNLWQIICLFGVLGAYELWMCFAKKENKTVVRPLFFYSCLILYDLYVGCARMAKWLISAQEALAVNDIVLRILSNTAPYIVFAALVYLLNKLRHRVSFMPLFLLGVIGEYFYVLLMRANHYYADMENYLPIVYLLVALAYAVYNKKKYLLHAVGLGLIIWFIGTFADDILDLFPCLLMCAVCAFAAYKAQSRRWFNVAVLAAVFRILGYYADVEDLQHMGLYLIGSGVVLIATILLLMKYGKLLWREKNEK